MNWKKITSSAVVALLAVAMAASAVSQDPVAVLPADIEVGKDTGDEQPETNAEEVDTQSENMIINGDFSDGTNHFAVYTNGGSYNMSRNADGELQMDITNTGDVNYGVQLYYDGFALDQGADYEFSFDVRGSVERDIEWRIQINGGDYHAYHSEVVDVTEETQHIVSKFRMEEPSDPAPRLCFNMGASDAVAKDEAHAIMLDNLVLRLVDDSNLVEQEAAIEAPKVKINQIGYHTGDTKIAVFSDLADDDNGFSVVDAKTGDIVYDGTITDSESYASTGEVDARGDFSEVTTPGTYKIVTAKGEESYEFEIGDGVYDRILSDVAQMYVLQRCGQELTEEQAGAFAHPACHTSLATIYGSNQQIDVTGGWHDAGDYGRYIVPAAKAVADLLLAYEKAPDALDGQIDLLEEVRYETDWMLKMQDPQTGGVYHKVTCKAFPGTVMPQDETDELVVSPLSKVASIDFAASMALASRVYGEQGDAAYAQTCLLAAQRAWDYYLLHKTERGFQNPSDISTGEYADGNSSQEYFWAAAELYKTTGDAQYKQAMSSALEEIDKTENLGGLGWMDVAGYGAYEALTTPQLLTDSSNLMADIRQLFLAAADEVVETAKANPYFVSRKSDFEWGSNMGIANDGMLLLLANEIAPDQDYVTYAKAQLNYLLGVNATGYCFVTGEGSLSPKNPHHRPSQVIGTCVTGMLVGGADNALEDPYAKAVLADAAPAKCYADNAQSFSCNEVTIYWNSPLLYLLLAND